MSKRIRLLVSILAVSLVFTGCNKETAEGVDNAGVAGTVIEKTEEGYNVEDAVFVTTDEKAQLIETVSGVSMADGVAGVKEVLEGMDITESYEDTLENVAMSGYFDFDAIRVISGADDKGNIITVTLKQYARFEKATYLGILYTNVEENKEKAKKLVERFYGEEIMEDAFSEDEVNIEYESESGEYSFKIFKAPIVLDGGEEESLGEIDLVSVSIDYVPVYVRENSIDDYVVMEEVKPLYREMKLFEGVPVKDIPNKIGDVWGNYKYGVISDSYNTYSNASGTEDRSMVLTSAIIHEDDTQTAVDIVVNLSEAGGDKYDIIGATPFKDTEEEAFLAAEDVLSAILETEIVYESGKEYKVNQFGKEFSMYTDFYSYTEDGKFFVKFEAYNK